MNFDRLPTYTDLNHGRTCGEANYTHIVESVNDAGDCDGAGELFNALDVLEALGVPIYDGGFVLKKDAEKLLVSREA